MKKMTRLFMIVLVLVIASSSAALAGIWSSTSMSYLYGSGYELASSEDASILTLEHASGWAYGDNFLFLDVFQPFAMDTGLYFEWHPRFSSKKILGNDGYGFVKDILVATEINVGSSWGSTNRAYLYGIGFDLDIPSFSFFSINFFMKDQFNRNDFGEGPFDREMSTYQISPSWNIPFALGGTKWTFGGFLDYTGSDGEFAASLLTAPQLLLDVSDLMGSPGNLYLGVEYQYWSNKYGVDGVDENVAQLMGKWFF